MCDVVVFGFTLVTTFETGMHTVSGDEGFTGAR
jgi:hypothetical protein